MRPCRYRYPLALVTSFAIFAGTTASASSIGTGFDSFVTDAGAFVDLNSFGLGIIPVDGVPIGPNPFGPDDADTIVERIQGIDPFDAPGGSGTIDIEIVALQLRSVAPVDLTPLGGPFVGVFGDLWATIDRDGAIPQLPQYDSLLPSIGQMTINHENPGGGTFTSCFGETSDALGTCPSQGVPGGGVYADGIFVTPGGDPTNPLDILFSAAAPRVVLSATDGTWIHDGSTDDFLVTSITHEGPHPVVPIIPEPSAALLAGLGLLYVRGGLRRRRGGLRPRFR